MNSTKSKQILQKVKSALSELEKTEGIKIVIGNLSYNSVSAKIQVEFIEKGEDLERVNKENSLNLGFTQNIVGMEFTAPGIKNEKKEMVKYRIERIATRNPKYPVITTQLTGINKGRSIKFPKRSVLSYLGGEKSINRLANLDALL